MSRASVLVLAAGCLALPAHAQDAAGVPSGLEIAHRINARDEGEAVSRRLLMLMTDKRGSERRRVTRSFRRYFGDEKRTVIFYQEPANVRDTAFLTYDYAEAGRDDDRWLYLPALRRVRRISASDRGDYFLGTDLTYEDVKNETRVSVRDYRWRNLGHEELDGRRCWLVEAVPVDEATARELGYGRLLLRVDPELWMARRVEYWDVEGRPLKRVDTGDIREVQGIWTPHRIEVENRRTGHRTLFLFEDVDYDKGVDEALFTERALRRGLR